MAMAEADLIGWDVGGAHVKACLLRRGEVHDVAQWPCPLWLGMDQLAPVLQAARERWPGLGAAQHAITMTGEMVDLFANREDGVRASLRNWRARCSRLRRRRHAARRCRPQQVRCISSPAMPAGAAAEDVAVHWEAIASANWLATAQHTALQFGTGLLVDIGSTTTDLIAFKDGRVLSHSRTDAQRLATGELVYQGVVRTPLCALAQRIDWRGTPHNVMNEFFATTADVYRLTGELDPAHDLVPSADNAPKDLPATRQRLARMIGLDQRDGTPDEWLDFARAWREAQVAELGGQLRRVMAAHGLGRDAVLVSAGCGGFLVGDVLVHANAGMTEPTPKLRLAAYGRDVARIAAHPSGDRATVQAWAQVCAPCVAMASLFDMGQR